MFHTILLAFNCDKYIIKTLIKLINAKKNTMLHVIIFPNSGRINFESLLKLQHGGRTNGLITDFSFRL